MDCDETDTKNPIARYMHLSRYLVYPTGQLLHLGFPSTPQVTFLSHEEPVHLSTFLQVVPSPLNPSGQLPHLNVPDPITVHFTPTKQGKRAHGFGSERIN